MNKSFKAIILALSSAAILSFSFAAWSAKVTFNIENFTNHIIIPTTALSGPHDGCSSPNNRTIVCENSSGGIHARIRFDYDSAKPPLYLGLLVNWPYKRGNFIFENIYVPVRVELSQRNWDGETDAYVTISIKDKQ